MAQLSLWKWIKKQPVGLPDPTKTTELSEAAATASANREVNRIYESSVTVNVHSESTTLPIVRVKRGSYHAFTDEIRAKIGRHALEHGNTCAVKHFTKELNFDIKESTVRNFNLSSRKPTLKNYSHQKILTVSLLCLIKTVVDL